LALRDFIITIIVKRVPAETVSRFAFKSKENAYRADFSMDVVMKFVFLRDRLRDMVKRARLLDSNF
jgi:hypothetical protein